MLKERDRALKQIALLIDIITISSAFVLSYILRESSGIEIRTPGFLPQAAVENNPTYTVHQYFLAYFVAVIIWCLSLYIARSYKFLRTEPYYKIAFRVINASLMSFFGYGTALFVLKAAYISRLFYFIFIIICGLLLLIEKAVFRAVLKKIHQQGYNFRRILLVGTGRRAEEFIRKVKRHKEWGLKIVGAINDDPARNITQVDGTPVIGTLSDLKDIFHRLAIDQVVFVIPRSRLTHVENAFHDCETEGVEASLAVDLYDMKIASSVMTEIDGIPLLSFTTVKVNEWQLMIKRIMDIIISLTAIFILSPIYIAAAVAIKLTSPGPVYFKQERLGLHGRKFKLLKFRTMRQEADRHLSQVNDLAEMTTDNFKQKKLKYITPVGRLLRKFSIDEFPQFFNVLVGEMSIVGPRPTVPCEVEKYKPWQRRRFSMKPGITCLWQISGRNEIGHDDWMRLDLEYIDNFSLWLDIKIILKTIPAVILAKGAY